MDHSGQFSTMSVERNVPRSRRGAKTLSFSFPPTTYGYILMARFFHPLIMALARATESELARYVEYLKAENRILRDRLPKRVPTFYYRRTQEKTQSNFPRMGGCPAQNLAIPGGFPAIFGISRGRGDQKMVLAIRQCRHAACHGETRYMLVDRRNVTSRPP